MNVFEIRDSVTVSKRIMIISGIVCAIPFVFEKLFLLSWIMFAPVYLVFAGELNIKTACKKVFGFGYFYFAVGYSWLCQLYPLDFAGFSQLEGLAVIVIAITAVPSIHAGLFVLSFWIFKKAVSHTETYVKILIFPCVFVISEFLQSVGIFAFPWCRMSVAQSGSLAIVQSTSLFGSYFIAYVVAFVNALLAEAIVSKKHRKILVMTGAVVFAVNIVFGGIRLSNMSKSFSDSPCVTGIALQGNIPSDEKWNISMEGTVNRYIRLADDSVKTAKAKGYKGETIVLFPETAFPFELENNPKYLSRVSECVKRNGVYAAVGAFSDEDDGNGNAVVMFSPDGKIQDSYLKQKLVPFGEFVPYRNFFEMFIPVLADINMLSSDLKKGDETVLFDIGKIKAGALVCYESVFHNLCRKSVQKGADIILVSTNDSWFGTSVALRHHLAAATIRAIENGVPVIRAANTGISAIIRSDGKVIKSLDADRRGYVMGEIPIGTGITLYSIIGDIWLYFCFAAILVLLIKQKINK